MKLTRQERETIINFNEVEGIAYIHTRSAPVWHDLERKGFVAVEVYRNGLLYGKDFEIPKGLVSIRRPRRKMSAEQRAKFLVRMTGMRKKQGILPLFPP